MNLLENERVDDLQYKGLKIIQNTKGFCFGVDAVLLADYARVKKGARVIDLGTGTGIIPILLASKTQAREIIGLEIQEYMADMARRSVLLNGLAQKVKVHHGDLKEADVLFGPAGFDAVVSNPPYMNKGGGLVNPDDAKALSRHEIACTLEDVIRISARLLVPGGKLYMIHRPERLSDIIFLMRNYRLEPKRMRMVHPDPDKKPSMVLIEGAKGGNIYLNIDKPLYVFRKDGSYSDEINKIYCRGENADDQSAT